jgi:hypothetical protein
MEMSSEVPADDLERVRMRFIADHLDFAVAVFAFGGARGHQQGGSSAAGRLTYMQS